MFFHHVEHWKYLIFAIFPKPINSNIKINNKKSTNMKLRAENIFVNTKTYTLIYYAHIIYLT